MEAVEHIAKYLYLPVGALLVASAAFSAWEAHQVHFRGRVQLIRLGSASLQGAELLKSKFAVLLLLQAIASLSAAAVVLVFNAVQPGFLIFLGLVSK